MNKIIFGLDESELVSFDKIKIHRDVLLPLQRLKAEALKAGFDLQATSGFRSFEAQKKIWNAKAKGHRSLLDDQGQPLEYSKLNSEEIMWAILRWSALPGTSRHHWGTDLDIFDGNALPSADYKVELTPQEVDGIFKPLHQWLTKRMEDDIDFPFYRPYQEDLGGVAPEMWHLSYIPLAKVMQKNLSYKRLFDFISQQPDLELKELILLNLEEIYERFILNISPYP